MRVILDSNVAIAAVAGRGLCDAVVELCLERHRLVLCDGIIEEIERGVGWKKRARQTGGVSEKGLPKGRFGNGNHRT